MEVKELLQLTHWFDEYVTKAKLIERLTECATQLQSNNNASANSVKRNYGSLLIEPFSGAQLQKLTKAQFSSLRSLDVVALLGSNANSYFDMTFSKEHSNKEIATALLSGRSALTKAKQTFDNLALHLPNVITLSPDEVEEIPQGYASIRLTFQDKASISDLSKLNVWAKKWYSIGRGFALVSSHKATEDIKVIGAGNGSIFLDLLGHLDTINMIGEAINHLLDIGLKIGEAYTLYVGIKALKNRMPVDQQHEAQGMLITAQKEFEDKKNTLYREAAEKLTKDKNVTNEELNALTKALRELDTYIRSGGNISYLSIGLSDDGSENQEQRELENRRQIDLEGSIKRLQKTPAAYLLEDKHEQEDDD
ncbi:hypothetical protein ND926_12335 [Vibrio diabolicus]|uniref:hypothetical protein n=1 Tax=Vibrio diabolicus TaxID=50719 RepID=UPI002160E724|nr:hypothetical protein [Vibrio diabolicus]MCS0338251.1 hypothetical protein [Vibrio diabolicus]